jgi:hypothetical protein
MDLTPFSIPELGPLEVAALRKRIEDLLGEESTRQGTLQRTAGEARSAYEDLAGSALPQLNPVESGTQQLFGDVASVISRRPEFGERTREDIKQRGAMLLQQRIQNIQLLRDRYQEEASKVGKLDPIKALELNEKTERMNKLLEQLHERDIAVFGAQQAGERTDKEQAGAKEREAMGNATAIKVAEINADARLLNALASGGKGTATTPDEHAKLIADWQSKFIVKGKPVDATKKPFYQQGLLAFPPPTGMTDVQWVDKMQRAFIGGNGGKPLSERQLTDIIAARAMHFAVEPPPPPAAPATPAVPEKPLVDMTQKELEDVARKKIIELRKQRTMKQQLGIQK